MNQIKKTHTQFIIFKSKRDDKKKLYIYKYIHLFDMENEKH